MCQSNNKVILHNEVYTNIQTGEVLDWERVDLLPDNAMLKVRPDLWIEWDFHKNDELGFDIWKMTKGSNKKAYWICYNKHPLKQSIGEKVLGLRCKYCSNKEVLIGFNDMWTTNPNLASLLANSENGYLYTQGSAKKVDWKCPDCDAIIKNKPIDRIKSQGLPCSICSDGISYPEKFMLYLLKDLGVEFDYNKSQEWSQSKMYDFIISEYNIIIETHGRQHYEHGFNKEKGRSLQVEQENDKYKRQLAIDNGFVNYFEIDCRYSNMNHIKDSILKSDLKMYFNFDDINWNDIHLKALKSFYIELLRLWNDEGLTIPEIAKVLKLNQATVNRKLHEFSELGLCVYDKRRPSKTSDKFNTVYQITLDYGVVRVWDKVYDIEDALGISHKRIYTACSGKSKTSHGFIWRYEKDIIGWSIPINQINN